MVDSLSLSNVIESDFRLAALETEQPERLFDVFKHLTLTTGKAVYGWSQDDGLYRLGTERIFIPQTRTIGDALSYIAASRHYGIYLLRDMGPSLQKPSIQKALARILDRDDQVRRLVIMLDSSLEVPPELEKSVVRIRHSVQGKEVNGRGR